MSLHCETEGVEKRFVSNLLREKIQNMRINPNSNILEFFFRIYFIFEELEGRIASLRTLRYTHSRVDPSGKQGRLLKEFYLICFVFV
jgi:hypothetical protein